MKRRAIFFGVDDYAHISPLSGAVADATAMRDFFSRPEWDFSADIYANPRYDGEVTARVGQMREGMVAGDGRRRGGGAPPRPDFPWLLDWRNGSDTAAVARSHGRGVAKNATEAVKWFRSAAVKGYALAQHSLGACLVNGDGVRKNYSEAIMWFRRAAAQGNAASKDALRQLGAR